MKNNQLRALTAYFDKWYIPSLVFLFLLGGFTVFGVFTAAVTPRWWPALLLMNSLSVVVEVAFVGILAASIWNLIRKRWAKGVANLLMLPLCIVLGYLAFGLLLFASMLGPSEDGFADNLQIPNALSISDPDEMLFAEAGGAQDRFQAAMLSALRAQGSEDPTVTGNIRTLTVLEGRNPDILRRSFASSPAWRVFEERGSVFATRRWMIGPAWRYKLHGYYRRNDIETWEESGSSKFQFRFTIGLSGKPWARGNNDTTRLKAGETAALKLSKLSLSSNTHKSHLVVSTESLAVEIFEETEAMERRLTKAALDYLDAEIAPLIEEPTWATIRKGLPADSVREGAPSFNLRNSFQPGIYDSTIWANTGEPGKIYLKAFEVTKGTPLSVNELKERSNEWIGWSDAPEELFFSNTHFTINEGDWGKPYAARFEVWFAPDSGGPERNLMQKMYKIEGWQR